MHRAKVAQDAIFIAKNAEHVKINSVKCKEFAAGFISNPIVYSTSAWKKHELNPKLMNADTINWIFLVDLLNFSFWTERQADGMKEFAVNGYRGYWSLCAAVNRALGNGIPVTSAKWMRDCTREQVESVFKPDEGCCSVSMIVERVDCLQRAGKILIEKLNGSFLTLILKSEKSALSLIDLIIYTFGDLFDDSCYYRGVSVSFFKRAQILIADVWACFEGEGYGSFVDIDSITMFADYRVPQALLYFGIIEYSNELKNLLQMHETHHLSSTSDKALNCMNVLERGNNFEVEIRGVSIHAVELVLEEIRSLKPDMPINAILLDYYLWDLAKDRKDEMRHIPIHRVRSIYY